MPCLGRFRMRLDCTASITNFHLIQPFVDCHVTPVAPVFSETLCKDFTGIAVQPKQPSIVEFAMHILARVLPTSAFAADRLTFLSR